LAAPCAVKILTQTSTKSRKKLRLIQI
jgi:hypothetical protein